MANKSLESVLQYLRRVALTGRGDDAQLLARFAWHADEAAFERLVMLHGPMVLGLCRRLLRHEQDAENAFQATFLTLARKAKTIGKKESLASWLYKVAYRVACRSRGRELTNREDLLSRVPAKSEDKELRGVLDEEIAGLAERYRRPVVLCYLQGKTVEQAARLLGCPVGTVASRLARAKEQLRRRLTRRGWALSAAALMTVLTDKSVAASLPPALVASTMACISGKSASTVAIAAKVFALSDGVLRMMWFNKMKMAAGVVLAVILAGTGVGLVVRETWAGGGEGQGENKEAVKAQKVAPKAEAQAGTKAEIEGLRKEMAALNRKLDTALKDIAVLKALRGINDLYVEVGKQTAPPPADASHEKKNAIEALFEGLPPDLQSKVQSNPVRIDRINDWLRKNVNDKKLVEFNPPLKHAHGSRRPDGTYAVQVQLGEARVSALGGTWVVVPYFAGGYVEANAAEAEKLFDSSQITVTGKVKGAFLVYHEPKRTYQIQLTLTNVQMNKKPLILFVEAKGKAKE